MDDTLPRWAQTMIDPCAPLRDAVQDFLLYWHRYEESTGSFGDVISAAHRLEAAIAAATPAEPAVGEP